MSLNRFVSLIILFICVLFASSAAFACACCVDPGYYEISTSKPSAYDLGIFGEMKFGVGELYMNTAGWDVIRGLNDLKADDEAGKSIALNVDESFLSKTWRLNMQTVGGRKGSLVLPMPTTMVRFKVDQHNNEPGTETSLYKEFRFKGTVAAGTGFLGKSIVGPTSYFLVFQGRGNGCDNSADYTHWRLELNGKNANFAFFGKLIQ